MKAGLGILLMIAAFGVMGFFMLPLIFEENETVYSWVGAVLCAQGETFTTDFATRGDFRGVRRGGQVYCVSPDGVQTEATLKSFLYAGGGFTVLFLVGLMLTMRALGRSATRATVVTAQSMGVDNDQLKQWLNDAGVSSGAVSLKIGDIAGSSKSLTDQLRDLQEAYDQRLISREEYESMRQQIIDTSTRS